MPRYLTARFETVPRRVRAEELVPTIRRCSLEYKYGVAIGDADFIQAASEEAWNAMTNLFEILRNEQDQGRLASSHMLTTTSYIVKDISQSELSSMISAKRINKSHPNYTQQNLRDTLNKIAHHDTDFVASRVDGRGAHYLILGGKHHSKIWATEILVSRLCRHSEAAIKAIVP